MRSGKPDRLPDPRVYQQHLAVRAFEGKTEESLPVPETAYGGSKLAAEKIHLAWQAAQPERKLLICGPVLSSGRAKAAMSRGWCAAW